jgi:hypothetical protein
MAVDLAGVRSAAEASYKSQIADIDASGVDAGQAKLMKLQAKMQMDQLIATTLSQMMKSEGDTADSIARNIG